MNFIEKIKLFIFNSSIKSNLLSLYITIVLIMGTMVITLLLYSINLNQSYNKLISNFTSYNVIDSKINTIDKDLYMNITGQRLFNEEAYAETISEINNALDNVSFNSPDNNISESVEVLKRTVNTIAKSIHASGVLINQNADYSQRQQQLDRVVEAKSLIKDNIQQLMSLDLSFSQKHIDHINKEYNAALGTIMALFVLAVLVSIFFLLLVTKGIVSKIKIVSENANKLANGDLSIDEICFGLSDEFQVLAKSFNQMKDNMNDYINQISSSRMRISTILNEMNDCVITTNSLGEIESCNYMIEKVFNYSESELLGKNINTLVSAIDFSLYQYNKLADKELVKSSEIIDNKYQLNAVKKDGSVFPIELSYKEVSLEDYKVVVFVIHDNTQHKEIERIKNEFISTISHELRTPLTSIRGALGLVLSEALGALPEKSKDLLNIASNNSIRLINLINDILDLEKIKAGKMDFTYAEYEVMSLIEETVKYNEEFAKQYNVRYEIIERLDGAFINVDREKFVQVVINLLSNAAKFSFKDEAVTISVKRKKGSILVEVVNKGAGIPEQHYSKIFQSFSQVDSSDSRKKGGTGLGLNIAKSIVQKMGGEIGFKSVVNESTTFFFELPEIVKSTTSKSVLICEDNKVTALCIKKMLEDMDYSADLVSTAADAQKLLSSKKYDLMTLDIILPDVDGMNFLEVLRADDKLKNLPIIIISSLTPDLEVMQKNSEVVDWLEKSFDIEDLKDSIAKLVLGKDKNKVEILHVENDEDLLSIVSATLKDIANVTGVKDLQSAREVISQTVFDIIILDYVFPEGTSDKLIPDIRLGINRKASLIVFSAYEESKILSKYVDAIFLKTNVSNDQFKSCIENFIQKKT